MASGHVNRTYRPNTWLHRPSLRREDFSCQPGAVHTWRAKRDQISDQYDPLSVPMTSESEFAVADAKGVPLVQALIAFRETTSR